MKSASSVFYESRQFENESKLEILCEKEGSFFDEFLLGTDSTTLRQLSKCRNEDSTQFTNLDMLVTKEKYMTIGVVHFVVSNIQRALDFYIGKLGLPQTKF